MFDPNPSVLAMDAAFPEPENYTDFYSQQAYFDEIDECVDDLPFGESLRWPRAFPSPALGATRGTAA